MMVTKNILVKPTLFSYFFFTFLLILYSFLFSETNDIFLLAAKVCSIVMHVRHVCYVLAVQHQYSITRFIWVLSSGDLFHNFKVQEIEKSSSQRTRKIHFSHCFEKWWSTSAFRSMETNIDGIQEKVNINFIPHYIVSRHKTLTYLYFRMWPVATLFIENQQGFKYVVMVYPVGIWE